MHIDTKLEPSTHLINRNQLVIACVAYNPRRDEILVCDGRTLRVWTHRAGNVTCRKEVMLPKKDVTAKHAFYNMRENQYILVLQSLEIQIVSPELVLVASLNTEQVSILAAAFSQARQRLVTTGGDGSIKIYRIELIHRTTSAGQQTLNRFRQQRAISSEYRWMKHVVLNEDDGQILAAHESSVLVWDLETGAQLFRLTDLHASRIRSLAFNPSDKHLMTSSYDGSVKKWSVTASISLGRPILVETMQCHAKELRSLVCDATGRLFFSCADDLVVKMWNAERGVELDMHIPSSFIASSLSTYACPPPSQLYYADASGGGAQGSGEGVLLVASGALLSVLRVKEPLLHFTSLSDRITRAQVSRTSARGAALGAEQSSVYALSANNAMQVLRLSNGQMTTMVVPRGLGGAADDSLAASFRSSAPIAVDASGSASKAQPHVSCFTHSPRMGFVLLGWHDGTIDILDPNDGGRTVQTLVDADMTVSISAITVVRAPPGWVCTRQRGRASLGAAPDGAGSPPPPPPPSASAAATAAAAESAGAELGALRNFCVVTGSARGHISLWGAAQPDVSRTFAAHSSEVVQLVSFAVQRVRVPGGAARHLLTVADDAAVEATESAGGAKDGAPPNVAPTPALEPPHAMISVGRDGVIRLWDMRGLQCVPRGAFRAAARGVTCALLRRDGGVLLGFEDGTIDLWMLLPSALDLVRPRSDDAAAARAGGAASNFFISRIASKVKSTEAHTERVNSLEVLVAADRFVSASADGSVLIWHLSAFTALKQFAFNEPITQALFASDECSFIAVLEDQMLLITREQVARAKEALPMQEEEAAEGGEEETEVDTSALSLPRVGGGARRSAASVRRSTVSSRASIASSARAQPAAERAAAAHAGSPLASAAERGAGPQISVSDVDATDEDDDDPTRRRLAPALAEAGPAAADAAARAADADADAARSAAAAASSGPRVVSSHDNVLLEMIERTRANAAGGGVEGAPAQAVSALAPSSLVSAALLSVRPRTGVSAGAGAEQRPLRPHTAVKAAAMRLDPVVAPPKGRTRRTQRALPSLGTARFDKLPEFVLDLTRSHAAAAETRAGDARAGAGSESSSLDSTPEGSPVHARRAGAGAGGGATASDGRTLAEPASAAPPPSVAWTGSAAPASDGAAAAEARAAALGDAALAAAPAGHEPDSAPAVLGAPDAAGASGAEGAPPLPTGSAAERGAGDDATAAPRGGGADALPEGELLPPEISHREVSLDELLGEQERIPDLPARPDAPPRGPDAPSASEATSAEGAQHEVSEGVSEDEQSSEPEGSAGLLLADEAEGADGIDALEYNAALMERHYESIRVATMAGHGHPRMWERMPAERRAATSEGPRPARRSPSPPRVLASAAGSSGGALSAEASRTLSNPSYLDDEVAEVSDHLSLRPPKSAPSEQPAASLAVEPSAWSDELERERAHLLAEASSVLDGSVARRPHTAVSLQSSSAPPAKTIVDLRFPEHAFSLEAASRAIHPSPVEVFLARREAAAAAARREAEARGLWAGPGPPYQLATIELDLGPQEQYPLVVGEVQPPPPRLLGGSGAVSPAALTAATALAPAADVAAAAAPGSAADEAPAMSPTGEAHEASPADNAPAHAEPDDELARAPAALERSSSFASSAPAEAEGATEDAPARHAAAEAEAPAEDRSERASGMEEGGASDAVAHELSSASGLSAAADEVAAPRIAVSAPRGAHAPHTVPPRPWTSEGGPDERDGPAPPRAASSAAKEPTESLAPSAPLAVRAAADEADERCAPSADPDAPPAAGAQPSASAADEGSGAEPTAGDGDGSMRKPRARPTPGAAAEQPSSCPSASQAAAASAAHGGAAEPSAASRGAQAQSAVASAGGAVREAPRGERRVGKGASAAAPKTARAGSTRKPDAEQRPKPTSGPRAAGGAAATPPARTASAPRPTTPPRGMLHASGTAIVVASPDEEAAGSGRGGAASRALGQPAAAVDVAGAAVAAAVGEVVPPTAAHAAAALAAVADRSRLQPAGPAGGAAGAGGAARALGTPQRAAAAMARPSHRPAGARAARGGAAEAAAAGAHEEASLLPPPASVGIPALRVVEEGEGEEAAEPSTRPQQPGAAQLAPHSLPPPSAQDEDSLRRDEDDDMREAMAALPVRRLSKFTEGIIAGASAPGADSRTLGAAIQRVSLFNGDWVAPQSTGQQVMFSVLLYGFEGARQKAIAAVLSDMLGPGHAAEAEVLLQPIRDQQRAEGAAAAEADGPDGADNAASAAVRPGSRGSAGACSRPASRDAERPWRVQRRPRSRGSGSAVEAQESGMDAGPEAQRSTSSRTPSGWAVSSGTLSGEPSTLVSSTEPPPPAGSSARADDAAMEPEAGALAEDAAAPAESAADGVAAAEDRPEPEPTTPAVAIAVGTGVAVPPALEPTPAPAAPGTRSQLAEPPKTAPARAVPPPPSGALSARAAPRGRTPLSAPKRPPPKTAPAQPAKPARGKAAAKRRTSPDRDSRVKSAGRQREQAAAAAQPGPAKPLTAEELAAREERISRGSTRLRRSLADAEKLHGLPTSEDAPAPEPIAEEEEDGETLLRRLAASAGSGAVNGGRGAPGRKDGRTGSRAKGQLRGLTQGPGKPPKGATAGTAKELSLRGSAVAVGAHAEPRGRPSIAHVRIAPGRRVLRPTPAQLTRKTGLRRTKSFELLLARSLEPPSLPRRPASASGAPRNVEPVGKRRASSVGARSLRRSKPSSRASEDDGSFGSDELRTSERPRKPGLPVRKQPSSKASRKGRRAPSRPQLAVSGTASDGSGSEDDEDLYDDAYEHAGRIDTIPEGADADGPARAVPVAILDEGAPAQPREQPLQQHWTWAEWENSKAPALDDDDDDDWLDIEGIDFETLAPQAFDALIEYQQLKKSRAGEFTHAQRDAERAKMLARLKEVLEEPYPVDAVPEAAEALHPLDEIYAADELPQSMSVEEASAPAAEAEAEEEEPVDEEAVQDLQLIDEFKAELGAELSPVRAADRSASAEYRGLVDALARRWAASQQGVEGPALGLRSGRSYQRPGTSESVLRSALSAGTKASAMLPHLAPTPGLVNYSLLPAHVTSSAAAAVAKRHELKRKSERSREMLSRKAPLPLAARAPPPSERLPPLSQQRRGSAGGYYYDYDE